MAIWCAPRNDIRPVRLPPGGLTRLTLQPPFILFEEAFEVLERDGSERLGRDFRLRLVFRPFQSRTLVPFGRPNVLTTDR